MRYYLIEKDEKLIKLSEQEIKVIEVFSGKKDLKDLIIKLICANNLGGVNNMAITNSHVVTDKSYITPY